MGYLTLRFSAFKESQLSRFNVICFWEILLSLTGLELVEFSVIFFCGDSMQQVRDIFSRYALSFFYCLISYFFVHVADFYLVLSTLLYFDEVGLTIQAFIHSLSSNPHCFSM